MRKFNMDDGRIEKIYNSRRAVEYGRGFSHGFDNPGSRVLFSLYTFMSGANTGSMFASRSYMLKWNKNDIEYVDGNIKNRRRWFREELCDGGRTDMTLEDMMEDDDE